MKRLVVLRHAKSSWGAEALGDRLRPLNGRGRLEASLVGQELKRQGAEFDLVLASPALRVQQTLQRLQDAYGALREACVEEELYLASGSTLLRRLRLVEDRVISTLLVGHNPGLQQLVSALVRPGEEKRQRVEQKFPTATAAMLELPISSWADAAPGIAAIADLILPRELDR